MNLSPSQQNRFIVDIIIKVLLSPLKNSILLGIQTTLNSLTARDIFHLKKEGLM